MDWLVENWKPLASATGWVAGAIILSLVVHRLVFRFLRGVKSRTASTVDDSIVRHSYRPTMYILPLAAVDLALLSLPLGAVGIGRLRHLALLGIIASVAWLCINMLNVVEDVLEQRYRLDVTDNLNARRVRTQYFVLRRTAAILIGTLGFAAMLMTFPAIWNIGAGLFASAGFAGLVVGMAARPTLSNLLAGLQLALTEPIRLDDVVIVEGEWGRIEEINATYVVVRIWDLRRLVVPLSYFIEKPFQNWTRISADLLGTVFLYTDYTVPVEEVRQELRRILESSDKWDGKVCGLQVTNATEHTMELRALMSAADSSKAWDLRCYVREKLIHFLQQRYPGSLPRVRAELPAAGRPAEPA
jgi:small-conductance mechanosensitive channel